MEVEVENKIVVPLLWVILGMGTLEFVSELVDSVEAKKIEIRPSMALRYK
jgi:hypothetical protein